MIARGYGSVPGTTPVDKIADGLTAHLAASATRFWWLLVPFQGRLRRQSGSAPVGFPQHHALPE